jgi:hypothetical protein
MLKIKTLQFALRVSHIQMALPQFAELRKFLDLFARNDFRQTNLYKIKKSITEV